MFETFKIKLLLKKLNEDNKPDIIQELVIKLKKEILPESLVKEVLPVIFAHGGYHHFEQIFLDRMVRQEVMWIMVTNALSSITGYSTFKNWFSIASNNLKTSRYIANMWNQNFNCQDASKENINLLVNYCPRSCTQETILKILRQFVPPAKQDLEYLYSRLDMEFSEQLWAEWLKSSVSIKKIQTRISDETVFSLFIHRYFETKSYNLLLLAQQNNLIKDKDWEAISNSDNDEEITFFASKSPEYIFKRYLKNLFFRNFDENVNFIINQRIRNTDFS